MNTGPLLRLIGFAVLLAAVFAAATLAGGAVDAQRPRDAGEAPHASTAAAPAPVRGLAVAEGRLRLELLGREPLRFRIAGAERFDVTHEKRMHLIVVRRDGTGFQHLHPSLVSGVWSADAELDEPGAYRVFADFAVDGRAHTLAVDVAVDGNATYAPFPAPADTARTAGGYEVALREDHGELAFTVRRDGRDARTEPYLGAGGHLVALREGDLAFLHTHPAEDGATRFDTHFPSAGRYRLYFQFQVGGRVETAEFTRDA